VTGAYSNRLHGHAGSHCTRCLRALYCFWNVERAPWQLILVACGAGATMKLLYYYYKFRNISKFLTILICKNLKYIAEFETLTSVVILASRDVTPCSLLQAKRHFGWMLVRLQARRISQARQRQEVGFVCYLPIVSSSTHEKEIKCSFESLAGFQPGLMTLYPRMKNISNIHRC
jgi:hypothetical protein